MKFDPTKFRLPGFFRRLLQNRQMKYVLLAVAFSALIIGAAVIYDELSKRYEQEIQPPVRTEQTMKTKPGTKATNEKKTAETTNEGENTADSSLESAATTGPEKSLEKETERASGATEQPVRNSGEDTAPKPPTPGMSQQQTNTEKPKDAEKTNNPENPAGTAKPESGIPNTEPPATEQPETAAPETDPPASYDPDKNTAPDFTVLDANGKKIRLSDNFGKPIVINFWATWCPPCKRELPDFDKLCKEYGDKVVFMMVNLTDGRRDTVDGTKSFVSKNGYTFPVYFDTEYNGADAYNVSSIPQTTFIDANGNVYTTRIGAMNEPVLRSYINALLGG